MTQIQDQPKKSARILIVEDEFIIAQDIQMSLESMGYVVPLVLSSAEKIMEMTRQSKPDLILMDIHLDGSVDGIQAAEILRTEFQIPLLFLTSYTDETTIQRAKMTDPFGYIVKPFQQNELRTTIEMALHKSILDRELKESQQWLSAVLRSILDGVIAVNQEGKVTFMNAVAELLTGKTQEAAKDQAFDAVFILKNERLGTVVKSPFAEVVDLGIPVRLSNVVLISAQGEEVPIEENWTPMRDLKGRTTGAVLVFRDLREKRESEKKRKDLEAQILHVQKLESIGVMAGGIAHDFNNLLCIILGNANLALSENLPFEQVKEKLRFIETTSIRASELVKQILSYSGKGKVMMEMVNLTHIVGEMGTLLNTSISKKVELEYQFNESIPTFLADAIQLRQVIMNLIINASDAIGDQRGKVTVSTGIVEVTQKQHPQVVIGQEILPGNYVYLQVTDTGSGMDAETKAKIFDPFFTTKFTGRGLGLAVVLGIVRAHSGAIELTSEKGKGTTFKVLFPIGHLDQVATPAKKQEVMQRRTPVEGGTILVIDDEGQILTLAREILEQEGFAVITAENGTQGLEEFERGNHGISAVVLDMTMPDLDGAETLSRMRAVRPDVKVILSSGYTEDEIISRLHAYAIQYFLQKPYQPKDLVNKVFQALEAPV